MAKIDGNTFAAAFKAQQSGRSFPALNLLRSAGTLETAAALSKAVADPHKRAVYNTDGSRRLPVPDASFFRTTHDRISQSGEDADTVMQLLPDQMIGANIFISCVVSPKDMMATELIHKVNEGVFSPALTAALLVEVREYFSQVHKIEPTLTDMLMDILFRTGSYPVAVIPESSVDELINGDATRLTLESFSDVFDTDGSVRSIGILGPPMPRVPRAESQSATVALEMFDNDTAAPNINDRVTLSKYNDGIAVETYLHVSDNINVLKIPQIGEKIRQKRVRQAFGRLGATAMESVKNDMATVNDRQMVARIYKTGASGHTPLRVMKTGNEVKRKSVGHPLIMHIPSEAVIPVFVPGTPEKQLGCFVLLDAEGHPVARHSNPDHYAEMAVRFNQNSNFASSMMQKVKGQMNGTSDWQFDSRNREHLTQATQLYGALVEKELIDRLRNGIYGSSVQLGKNDDIYRIMMARSLARQHTQLLFLPGELITYFALKYNNDGTGRSIMDDSRVLNSLRTMLMFADTMAAIRNSIPRTDVQVTLDPDDPDPKRSLDQAVDTIMRTRTTRFPLGVNSPVDQVDHLQRAGMQFSFEGHPGLPNVKAAFTETNNNYVKPDTDLSDRLSKQTIMALGVSPSNVDAAHEAEFAASIVNENLLLAKRVQTVQEKFTPLLRRHMVNSMQNSAPLAEKLRSVIKANWKELDLKETEEAKQMLGNTVTAADPDKGKAAYDKERAQDLIVEDVLGIFFNNYEVELPKPNVTSLRRQLEALKDYIEALDIGLDAHFSEEFLDSNMIGDAANNIRSMKLAIRASYIRAWMADNGMLVELNKITAKDDNGQQAADFFKNQEAEISGLLKSALAFIKGISKTREKAQAELEKAGITPEPSTGGTDDTGGGDDGGGSLGGPPEMGDLDFPMDDTGGGDGAGTGTEAPGAGGGETGEPAKTANAEGDQPAGNKPEGDAADAPA